MFQYLIRSGAFFSWCNKHIEVQHSVLSWLTIWGSWHLILSTLQHLILILQVCHERIPEEEASKSSTITIHTEKPALQRYISKIGAATRLYEGKCDRLSLFNSILARWEEPTLRLKTIRHMLSASLKKVVCSVYTNADLIGQETRELENAGPIQGQ